MSTEPQDPKVSSANDPPVRQLSIKDLMAQRAAESSGEAEGGLPPPPPPSPEGPSDSSGSPRAFPFAPRSSGTNATPVFAGAPPLPPPPAGHGAALPQAEPEFRVGGQNQVTFDALTAGALAGFAGAVVWALLIWALRIELGWMAVAVGSGIGFAANYRGGRGMMCGLLCAAIALFSMASGRVIGLQLAYSGIIRDEVQATGFLKGPTSEFGYEHFVAVAESYDPAMTDEDLEQRMDYWGSIPRSPFEGAESLTAAEFRSEYEPRLVAFQTNPVEYEAWRDAEQQRMIDEVNKTEVLNRIALVLGGFSALDIVFVLLGLGAAFMQGGKKDGDL